MHGNSSFLCAKNASKCKLAMYVVIKMLTTVQVAYHTNQT